MPIIQATVCGGVPPLVVTEAEPLLLPKQVAGVGEPFSCISRGELGWVTVYVKLREHWLASRIVRLYVPATRPEMFLVTAVNPPGPVQEKVWAPVPPVGLGSKIEPLFPPKHDTELITTNELAI